MRRNLILFAPALAPALTLAAAGPLAAQDITPASGIGADGEYIFNTLLFLLGGILVFWMAAGFAMLEAGLVRAKNVTTQLFKNIALFSIAGTMYWLIGYKLMYPGDGWTIAGWVGTLFSPAVIEPVAGAVAGDSYAAGSDFFFQLMFCATTASIVSGTVAERIKIWPFMLFTFVLTGLIYPIEASWLWGEGWLDALGFSDFAGSTLVHAAGGAAALAGAIFLGPRLGRYKGGRVNPMQGSNLALALLGTFILWMGWFGFNGASQLALGTINDASDVSRIFVNTNAAAAAGVIAALLTTQFIYRKIDLTLVLNGALAGLVSITAEPLFPSIGGAVAIGAVGGVIAVVAVPLLDRLRIDDVVGAIPVHLIAGFWGTMAVPLSNPETGFVTQFVGFAAIAGFVFLASALVWMVLRATMGLRVSTETEINGLDTHEMGMNAYPDFVLAK
ncbi:MAG: ammonium transporter [Paracoccus sp. (in: a-proteobacteria)]|nr:ammonium transporter [Paracoccus sp. (in: a-proteobacteria)]